MMKSYTLKFLLFFSAIIYFNNNVDAQTYYSDGTGNFNVPALWNTNRDGSGTVANLADFTSGTATFIVENGDVLTQTSVLNINSFTVEAGGTLSGGANDFTINGNLGVEATASFTASSLNTLLLGDATIDGTFIHNSGTFIFSDGAANSDFNGIATFNSLIIDKSPNSEAIIVNAGSDQITAATTEIRSGTLQLTRINAASNLGTVTGSTGTHIYINGANITNWDNLGDFSAYMGVSGTEIRYVGTGSYNVPSTIDGVNYKIVSFADGGTKTISAVTTVDEDLNVLSNTTLSLTGTLTVNGNVLINNSAIINDGGLTHTVGGNWTEDGGSLTGTGTIQFTTGTHQITSSGTDALDFNNIIALAGSTLSFDETETTNITGIISTNGNCDNLVTINSVVGANQADLNVSGAISWDGVTVTDINEIGAGSITVDRGSVSNSTNIAAPSGTCEVLYWVGGAGDWSTAANWSATSGGAGGAGPPTTTTDVIFDANSFTAPGQRVRTQGGANPSVCKSMDWSAVPAGRTPEFASGNRDLEIYGSLILNADMNWNFNREIRFEGTGDFLITTNGQTIINDFQFNNVNGSWTLVDAFTSSDDIELRAGTLNTNDQTITARRFDANVGGSNNRTVNLGASTMSLTGNGNEVMDLRAANFTLNAGTSNIIFTFNGGNTDIRVELGNNTGHTFHNVRVVGPSGSNRVVFRNGSDAITSTLNNIVLDNNQRIYFSHPIQVNGNIDAGNTCTFDTERAISVVGTTTFGTAANFSVCNDNNGTATFTGNVTLGNGTTDFDINQDAVFGGNVLIGTNATEVDFRDNTTFQGTFTTLGTTAADARIQFYGTNQFDGAVSLTGAATNFAITFEGSSNNTFNSTVEITANTRVEFEHTDIFNGDLTLGDNARVYFTNNNSGGTTTSINANVTAGNNVIFESNRDLTITGNFIFGEAADVMVCENAGVLNVGGITTIGINTVEFDVRGRPSTFTGDVTIGTGSREVDFFNQTIFNGAFTLNGTAAVSDAVEFHGNNTFGDGTGNDAVSLSSAATDWAIQFENGSTSNTFNNSAPVTIVANSRVLFRGTTVMNSTLAVGNDVRVLFAWDGGTSTFVGNVNVGNNVRFEPRRDNIFNGDLVFGDAADARFNESSGVSRIDGVTTFGDNTVEAWFDRGSTHIGAVTFGNNTGTGGERIRFDGTSDFQGGFTLNGTNANATRLRFWGTNTFSGGTVTLNGVANNWSIRFEDNSTATFAADAPVIVGDNSTVWIAGTSTMNSTLNIGDDVDIIFADNQGTSTFVGNVTVGNNAFFEPRRQANFSGNLVFGDAADARFNSDDGTTVINGLTTFGNNTVEAFFDRGSTHVGLVTFGTNSGTGGDRLRFDGTSNFQGGFLLQGTPASSERLRFFGTNNFSGGTVDFNSAATNWAINFDVNANSTFAVDAPVIFRNGTRAIFRGNDTFNGTVTGEDNVRILFTGDWNNARTTAVNNTFTFGNDVYIASYHDFSVTGNVVIGDGAEFHITDNTGSSSFGGTVTFGNNTIEAYWDRSATFAGLVTFGTGSGTANDRIRWDGTTNFNGGLLIQGTANAANAVRFFGVTNFSGGNVDITSSATQWTVDFDDNTTVTCAADAPVIIRNGSYVRFRGDDTFNGTFTAEDNTRILFTGDWNNAAVSNFNGVTTFGNNVRLESYHSFNCTSTLTVGDNAYIHIVNNQGSATFDGAVLIGNGLTRLYIDRGNTFNSTLTIGNNASNVIFADAGGTTTFNGDVSFGTSSDIRFDNRITANNQNITLGAGTDVDFNTGNSPNTLHNLTLTQGNEVIFERDEDFNFTGQILMTAPYTDCSAGHFLRSSDWDTRARLTFTTDHTWYGVIVQSLQVSGATITAQYSSNYRNNTGITFDNTYVNTSNVGAGSQDLYWVGGTLGNTKIWPFNNGNRQDDWDNPQNWSTASGGASGSCIPRTQHNVIFDGNSFNDGTNLTVHVNTATAIAHDMTWTAGVLNTPTLNIDNDLSLSGSLSLSSNPMIVSGDDDLFFIATTTGETVTTNGTILDNDDVYFNGAAGEWTFQDNFDIVDDLFLQQGHLITGANTITFDQFTANNNGSFTDTRELTISANALMITEGRLFDIRGKSRGFTYNNPGADATLRFTYTGTGNVNFETGNSAGRIIPDIDVRDVRDLDINTRNTTDTGDGDNSSRLTFRNISRTSTVAHNFKIEGTTPKTFGNINLGDNLSFNTGDNRIRGNDSAINYYNGTVNIGDDGVMDFEGLNYYAQNVTFGNNVDIEFDREGQYFTGGANLIFGNDATFNAEDSLDITGNLTFGTGGNARINDNRGTTEIDGTLTIGADANQIVFERTGIFNGIVDIGNNATVQFAEGGNFTSTFNNTVTTGSGSFVRFQEEATFNALLTTGTSSRTRFGEDNGHTYFNTNVNLGNNSNNTFYEDVTFDTSTPGTYTLTYGNNSVSLVEDDNGDYDNVVLNTGASVVYNNDNNNYFNITLTNFNTIELSDNNLSTITGTFTASVSCAEWAIVRSSVQGNQANLNFTNPQTWDNVVVQDLNVVDASALLTITDGVNLRNLSDTDGTPTTNGTDGDPATIDITERAPLNFYWTGGGADDNWSNPDNWSNTNSNTVELGGCVPNPIDNVIFDNGSFNAPGNVNIDITNAACFSMSWDLDQDVTLTGAFVEDRVMIFNDLVWDERIDNQFPGIFEFQSNARYENEVSGSFIVNSISTDAGVLSFNGGAAFDADQNQTAGNWILQSAIDINDGVPDIYNGYFNIIRGVFNANQQAINVEGDFILEDPGRFLYDSDGTGGNNIGGVQTVTFDGDVTNVNIYMRDDDNDNPFHNIVVNKDNTDHDVRIRTEHFRIENNLTITQGRFWDSDEGNGGPYAIRNISNTAASAGTISIAANGTLLLGDNQDNDATSEFPNIFATITLDAASTVNYRDNGAQNITAIGVPYGNLILSNGDDQDDRAKQLQGAITVNGDLTINDSYVFDNGHQITGNTGGTSSFSMINDGRIYIGVIGTATVMPDFDSYSFDNNSWIYFESDQPQTIKGIDDGGAGQGSYANIFIRNDNNAAVTTPVLKTLDAPMRVRRHLEIGSDVDFWDDGNQITALDDNDCELFMYADSYLRLGNATTATTFPTFQSDEIDLNQGSTVIYAAGVNQEVRRFANGDDDRSYWNIWFINMDSVSAPATLPTKTLASLPSPGNDNLRFRQDFKIGEYTHLIDNGFQVNGEGTDLARTDIIWVGQQSILTLGTATTATEFPRQTEVVNIDLDPTSHVIYNAGVNQTVKGIFTDTNADNIPDGNSNYGLLTIRNIADATMRAKTLDEAIGIRSTFVIENNNNLTDAGFQIYGIATQTLDLNGNAEITLGNATTATEFPLNYTNSDIDISASTTIRYDAGINQNVRRLSSVTPNQNYGNLVIRNNGGVGTVNKVFTATPATADASTNVQIRGTLQVQSNNNLQDDGHQIIGTASQSFELQSAAQLTIGNTTTATVFPQNYLDADLNLNAASIVEYNAGVPQNIRGLNSLTDSQVYGEIHFNNVGNKTLLAALRYRTNMLTYDGNNVYDAGFQITGQNGALFEIQGSSNFYFGDAVQVGATQFPISVLNDDVTLSLASTIYYQDNQPQFVRKLAGSVDAVENYGNLNLSNSNKTIAASPDATTSYLDNLHVRGELNINNVTFSLNDQRLVLSGTLARVNGVFEGSDDSKMTIRGSGALGADLHFAAPPTTDLSDLLLNRTGGINIVLGTSLAIGTNPGFNGSLTLTEGNLVLGGNGLSINSGANQFNRTNGAFIGGPAGNTSVLVIRGTGDFGNPIVFAAGGRELRELGIDRTGRMDMGSPLFLNTKIGLKNGIIRTDATNYITMGVLATIRDFDTDTEAESNIHPAGGPKGGNSGFGSSGGSHESHIEGPMAKVFDPTAGGKFRGAGLGFRFPIGKAGSLREIGVAEVGKMEADAGDGTVVWPTTFLAEYINTAPPKPGQSGLRSGTNMTHVSSVEYWELDRIAGDASAKVIMHWDTNTDVATASTQFDNLRVAHYDETAEEWESIGESNELDYDTDLGYIVSPEAADDFSPYSFGSTSLLNLLPIELKSFDAKLKQDEGIELTWEAVETNSEGYILKRSIGNTNSFKEIASYLDNNSLISKNDAGNVSSYFYLDNNNIEPGEVHYYMLEQVDKDGNVTSFDIRAVNVGAKVVLYQNHPNPASHYTTISFSIEKEARTKLEVFDMSGRYVSTIVNEVIEVGTHQFDYDVSDLQTGVYTVKMTYGDKVLNIKMLVSR